MRTDIVTATPELLTRFYGHPPKRTMRAVAAVRGERVIGIAGIYPDGHRQVMFSELTDEIRADRRAIVRGIRAVTELARARGTAVHARAAEVDGAERMLEHIGFVKVHPEVFVWKP